MLKILIFLNFCVIRFAGVGARCVYVGHFYSAYYCKHACYYYGGGYKYYQFCYRSHICLCGSDNGSCPC